MMDSQDLESQIDRIAGSYVSRRENVALTIGVIQQDRHYIKGFGKLSGTQPSTPGAHTVYEIGSVTKILTGTVLAALVNEKTVLLEDSIRLYLPAEVISQLHFSIQSITLLQLATHTSGLPRLPASLLEAVDDPANPYSQYTVEKMYTDLEKVTLLNESGHHYEYSNLGMGLLGHLLSLKVSQPYEKLVKNIICQPLGMTDTTILLTPEQQRYLTPGHSSNGTLTSNWNFGAMAPAGAFRSTVKDLLTFLQANLHKTDTQVSSALARSQERCFEDNPILHIGLAWHISTLWNGQVVYWHNGGTGGYFSFIGFDQENQTGAIVLSNYGDAFANDASVDEMGVRILIELSSQ